MKEVEKVIPARKLGKATRWIIKDKGIGVKKCVYTLESVQDGRKIRVYADKSLKEFKGNNFRVEGTKYTANRKKIVSIVDDDEPLIENATSDVLPAISKIHESNDEHLVCNKSLIENNTSTILSSKPEVIKHVDDHNVCNDDIKYSRTYSDGSSHVSDSSKVEVKEKLFDDFEKGIARLPQTSYVKPEYIRNGAPSLHISKDDLNKIGKKCMLDKCGVPKASSFFMEMESRVNRKNPSALKTDMMPLYLGMLRKNSYTNWDN